jgi:predicted porin
MKNTLIIGPVIFALTLLPRDATAQSSVTLYGTVDTSLEYANAGNGGQARLDTGNLAASRWGLTGVEDIGGGTRIIFKLENGFSSTNGVALQNGAMFGREAWIGVQGAFGRVQAGTSYTPLHTTFITFAQPGLGNGLGWGNAANSFVFVPSLRASNSIRYVSPSFAGLTARGFYSFGGNGVAGVPGNLGKDIGAGLNYVNGAFAADFNFMSQGFAANPSGSGSASGSIPTAAGNYVLIGASYDFGMVKPSLLIERHRGGPDVGSANASNYANPKHDFYSLDITAPLGNGLLLMSAGLYRNLADSDGNAATGALRYDYRLSARTTLYAGAAYLRNRAHASFTISGAAAAGPAASAGASVTSAVVGMKHTF